MLGSHHSYCVTVIIRVKTPRLVDASWALMPCEPCAALHINKTHRITAKTEDWRVSVSKNCHGRNRRLKTIWGFRLILIIKSPILQIKVELKKTIKIYRQKSIHRHIRGKLIPLSQHSATCVSDRLNSISSVNIVNSWFGPGGLLLSF